MPSRTESDPGPPTRRHELEEEKLTAEIRELQEAPRRAWRALLLSVGTAASAAITTLIVALVGGYITLQVQHFADRQKNAEIYANLLQNLGSTNVPARAGAVVGLTKFAIEDPDRSAQTITILVTQLGFEEDTRVLRVLIPGIVSIGQTALDEVVRANRSGYKKYVSTVQSFVTAKINPLKYYSELPNGKRGKAVKSDASAVFEDAEEIIGAKLDVDLLTSSEEDITNNQYRFSRTPQMDLRDAPLNILLYRIAAGQDRTFGLTRTLFRPTTRE
jgi:hypothetical protein